MNVRAAESKITSAKPVGSEFFLRVIGQTDPQQGNIILEDSRKLLNPLTLVRERNYLFQFYASPHLFKEIIERPPPERLAVCISERSLQPDLFRLLQPGQMALKLLPSVKADQKGIVLVAEAVIRPESIKRDFMSACLALKPLPSPEPCAVLEAYLPHNLSVRTPVISVIVAPR